MYSNTYLIISIHDHQSQEKQETHLVLHHTLVDKILAQPLHNLNLLLDTQPRNRHLQHRPHTRPMLRNKPLIIHIRQRPHNKLAIHAVRDAAVPGHTVPEILDLERAFDARGEETAEGRDERGEGGED